MLHAGQVPDPYVGARAAPIYQTTSYVFGDTDEAAHLFELKQYGNIYTRISNPTTAIFEERIASLENGTGAVAVASGMAAQFGTIMTLCAPGDEIVASSQLYGGTITQLTHTLKKLSIGVTFVDPFDNDAWEPALTDKTKAMFVETIGNPSGAIADLEFLAGLAKAKRIPLIVDNTFATPYLCRPIDWGATIVIHSATKFIGGHGTSIGGAVIDCGEFDFSRWPTIAAESPSYHGLRFYDTFGHYGFLMKLRTETVRDTGACISPFNSFLLLQGLETLSLRMERHVATRSRWRRSWQGTRRSNASTMRGCPGTPIWSERGSICRWGRGRCSHSSFPREAGTLGRQGSGSSSRFRSFRIWQTWATPRVW